jgi:hypothetical protein
MPPPGQERQDEQNQQDSEFVNPEILSISLSDCLAADATTLQHWCGGRAAAP